MASLIRELWFADIKTRKSCEEVRPGFAWIEFRSLNDAGKFVDIVGEDEDGAESSYERIGRQSDASEETRMHFWEYGLHPIESQQFFEEEGNGTGDCEQCGQPMSRFLFVPSITFPVSDLPVLVERMKRHNRQRVEGARFSRDLKALIDDVAARLVGAKRDLTDARLTDQLAAHREELLAFLTGVEIPLLEEVSKIVEEPERLLNITS